MNHGVYFPVHITAHGNIQPNALKLTGRILTEQMGNDSKHTLNKIQEFLKVNVEYSAVAESAIDVNPISVLST